MANASHSAELYARERRRNRRLGTAGAGLVTSAVAVEEAAEEAVSALRRACAHRSRSLGFQLLYKTQELGCCHPPNPRKVAGELRSRIPSRSPASWRTTPPHAWLAGALRALPQPCPCGIFHARREKARRACSVAPNYTVRVVARPPCPPPTKAEPAPEIGERKMESVE